MEMQLQELIDQIKKNGVEVAEKQASDIISTANAEAEKIIADAKKQADDIIRAAKEENERLVASGEQALRQAARNVLISFRESVTKELTALTSKNVTDAFSTEVLSDLIVKVVLAWSAEPEVDDITVLLSEKDAVALESTLLSSLNAHINEGVTLRASNSFDGGFRISINGGSAYYDYSSEAVTDMLSAYLSPRVTALLKEAEVS